MLNATAKPFPPVLGAEGVEITFRPFIMTPASDEVRSGFAPLLTVRSWKMTSLSCASGAMLPPTVRAC